MYLPLSISLSLYAYIYIYIYIYITIDTVRRLCLSAVLCLNSFQTTGTGT